LYYRILDPLAANLTRLPSLKLWEMQSLGLDDVPKKDPAKKASSRVLLVASCSAVLTVYAAGYIRTQDAADRLASQIAKRRATVSTPQQAHLSIRDSAAFNAEREEHGNHRKPIEEVPLRLPGPPKPPPEAFSRRTFSENALPNSLPASVPKTETPIPTPTPVSPPAEVAAVIAAPPAPAPAIAADGSADTTSAPAHVWKDGSYSGWGYSRHGNIEATVVIEGGRIASAIISQCRTRYSCSVIDRLPPQVAQRQSPDVDYVTGATQSADAFYGAVVEALGKAALK
jgi:uncharacterized protein with FMN-binding domain